MPDIASVLKQEIARLARKEIRSETAAMRKANTQYRREIAQLKREVGALERKVGHLERAERKRIGSRPAASNAESVAEGLRFSRRGLTTHREKLGISAADYGALVGVTAQTIYNWEQGRSRPDGDRLAALSRVRGIGKRDALARLELLEA